jgi:hypothetical protein
LNGFVLPATPIEKARVHAIQICGKQRSLIATGTRADLDDRGSVVERIGGNEQRFELTLEPIDTLLCPLHFRTRLSSELFVVNKNELARLRELVIELV